MGYLKSAITVLLLALLTGCTASEKPVAEGKGKVVATQEFVSHFGAAPVVDKGMAYAFVIFFPSAREPGKVIPFPFFSFDEESLKKVALGKLLSGVGVKGLDGEVSAGFPPGTRLLDVTQAGGTVTANFTKELAAVKPEAQAGRALASAIVLTLRQFEGVTGVAIEVEGVRGSLDKMAQGAGPDAVVKLAAPRLLSVTAMKEKGESAVEEVDAFFDRPVQIKELVISGPDGMPLKGEMYHSVFDMAGVLKPGAPLKLEQGVPVKVRWKVVDNVGRAGSGESEVPLEVREH